MDHFQRIYSGRAAAYHQMIAAEDAEGQLRAALAALGDWRGRRVLDVGSGTGRVPLLLHGTGARTTAVDLYQAMLDEQAIQRDAVDGRWPLVRADIRALPLRDACVDVVIAGWALGHSRGWHPVDWQVQIGAMLREMHRVVVPGGSIVVLETLSTGAERPAPPTEELAEYYRWLEGTWGFTGEALRTDYVFPDVDAAIQATEFFFGADLAATIRARGWSRLPEWTGMWRKRTPEAR